MIKVSRGGAATQRLHQSFCVGIKIIYLIFQYAAASLRRCEKYYFPGSANAT
jgi:hypothetical protein